MSKTKTIPVLFRTGWDGVTFALLPTEPGDNDPYHCACYQHAGQHGAADCAYAYAESRAATPAEYADLLAEMTALGYSLRPVSRLLGLYADRRRWNREGVPF